MNEILEYNLVDCLSTWFVYEKYKDRLIADKQEDIYKTIMLPSLKVICQMELTGMPMDMAAVQKAESELLINKAVTQVALTKNPLMPAFDRKLKLEALLVREDKLKKKKAIPEDVAHVRFNPASNQQVGRLLHNHFGLPIIDKTKTGLPAVGAKTLKKHLNRLIQKHNITEDELSE